MKTILWIFIALLGIGAIAYAAKPELFSSVSQPSAMEKRVLMYQKVWMGQKIIVQ